MIKILVTGTTGREAIRTFRHGDADLRQFVLQRLAAFKVPLKVAPATGEGGAGGNGGLEVEAMSRKPLIVGLGGTIRAGSSTEKALVRALARAEALGAETRLLGGEFLGSLPIFDPRPSEPTAAQLQLADAMRAADGIIVASPGYHGSISGVIKNALDTLELTGRDARPYLSSKPVGTIITAAGAQAGGTTLMALRAIIHALRGWPTPFGAALNAANDLFDEAGGCRDEKDAWQLDTVAEQVMEFASMRIGR